MAAETHRFDGEWLDRRARFLIDRAEAHLEKEDIRSRACAATLLRDAAAVAFIQDEPSRGRELLGRAGAHFLKLGLPHGMLLITLADAGEGGESALDFMIQAATRSAAGEGRRFDHAEVGPLFASALHQPEQLLALEASAAIREPRYRVAGERARVREMLRPFREHPVGPSGLPLTTYMRLMDLGRGLGERDDDAPGNVQLDSMTLFAQRGRQLASAVADGYHWRLLLSPAALIDFDLVALFLVWWVHGRPLDGMVPDLGDRLPPMMMMPIEIARLLRPQEGHIQG